VRCFALCRHERGSQEIRECAVKVRAAHPFGNGKCALLMFVPILRREAPVPERWIDFCHDRSSRRWSKQR